MIPQPLTTNTKTLGTKQREARFWAFDFYCVVDMLWAFFYSFINILLWHLNRSNQNSIFIKYYEFLPYIDIKNFPLAHLHRELKFTVSTYCLRCGETIKAIAFTLQSNAQKSEEIRLVDSLKVAGNNLILFHLNW